MLKTFAVVIFVLLCIQVFGQPFASTEEYLVDSLDLNSISKKDRILIDSALLQYTNCPTDTCRIQAINQIVIESWDDEIWPKYNLWIHDFVAEKLNQNPDTIILNALQKFYAGTLNNIGYLHNSKGETDQALAVYDKCLEIQKRINDRAGLSGTYVNMGYIFLNQGIIEKAIEYYYKSLKIEEGLQNQSGIALALNGIGYIQYQQGDNKKALKNYNKSLSIREQLNDKYGIATCLNNIGLIYKDNGEWKKALDNYQRCLKLEEELADKNGIAISLSNIGLVYSSLNETEKALDNYMKSLSIRQELDDKLGMSQSLNSIANISLLKGDYQNARINAKKSLSIAQELKYPIYIRDASQTLSAIAKKEKKWEEAIKYYELYIQMRDSVFNEETIATSIHQQYKYSYEKRALADSVENANEQRIQHAELTASEAEQKRLGLLASKQRQESYFLVFAFFAALALSLLSYYRLKAIKKHKNIIEEQKKDLENLNLDLEEFAHIVSHDLKTPLHQILGLLHLIEEDFPNLEKDLMEKLAMIRNSSLESNALIDGVLSYSEAGKNQMDFESIDVDALVKSVIEHANNPNEVEVTITSKLPTIKCNEYQFYQIFSNLISNAIKYNHLERRKGKVNIHCSSNNEMFEFIVSDNGPGIPDDLQSKVFEIFQKAHHSEDIDSTGIGLSIVKKLVNQNGGTISINSNLGSGSSFIFTWPVQHNHSIGLQKTKY